jgi:cysteinyl-tRNA synthetase
MHITLYNTRTRSKEPFVSISPKHVHLYACGPTVYDYVHLGNLRSYLFEDILVRTLRYTGYQVQHVMNITDVGHLTGDTDDTGEDKMEKGARREGKSAWDIAKQFETAFFEHAAMMNITRPTIVCRATEHIEQQINQVQTLIDRGHTYETSDGIYFDTTTINDYGALANLQAQEQRAGARVEMGEKKHAQDFALWKFTQPGETRQMEWTAFGRQGFPGWHIECSAMAMHYLGDHIDIHCGGIDHIPIHHTNEIAQAECAGAHSPWVNVWMHNEFLLIDNTRMGKSLGNGYTILTLTERGYDPLAYRYFLLTSHYRKQLNFTWDALDAAAKGYKHIKKAIQSLPIADGSADDAFAQTWQAAIADDLNTAEAIGQLFAAVKDKTISQTAVAEIDQILGLDLLKQDEVAPLPPEIIALAEARIEARANKDWAKSDALRDALHEAGYAVEDTADGQKISLQ